MPLPLGEVDATSGSRRRGRAPTFPQRCAFAESGAANAIFLYDPSRENSVWSAPQSATNAKFKIFFPLIMRKANAARIPNRLFAARNVQPFPLFHPPKVKNPAEKRSRWFKKQFGCVILEAKVPVGRGNRRARLRVPRGTKLSPGGRNVRGKNHSSCKPERRRW